MNKEINVFIVSPNDVEKERSIAKEVCEFFDRILGRRVKVNALLWEYNPMSYHKNAQENIDEVLNRCDIYIVILWHRLGSVIEGYEGAITKSKHVTGTQYEIEKILATKKEAVYFYFKRAQKHFIADELEEALTQQKLLDDFLKKIHLTKGSTKHGYHDFLDENEFREKLTSHLKEKIQEMTGKKIHIPVKKQKNKTVIWKKYLWIVLYLFVAGIGFFVWMRYYYLPYLQQDFGVLIHKENALKQNIKMKKEHLKKVHFSETERMRELSTSPYYIHFRQNNTEGLHFTVAQWRELSGLSKKERDALVLEKKRYKKYIEEQLSSVKKQLGNLSSLKGEKLQALFYHYSQSDDLHTDISENQMRETLFNYLNRGKQALLGIYQELERL